MKHDQIKTKDKVGVCAVVVGLFVCGFLVGRYKFPNIPGSHPKPWATTKATAIGKVVFVDAEEAFYVGRDFYEVKIKAVDDVICIAQHTFDGKDTNGWAEPLRFHNVCQWEQFVYVIGNKIDVLNARRRGLIDCAKKESQP